MAVFGRHGEGGVNTSWARSLNRLSPPLRRDDNRKQYPHAIMPDACGRRLVRGHPGKQLPPDCTMRCNDFMESFRHPLALSTCLTLLLVSHQTPENDNVRCNSGYPIISSDKLNICQLCYSESSLDGMGSQGLSFHLPHGTVYLSAFGTERKDTDRQE